jgi:tetratricopeptide (TPR) repeat protein
MLRLRLAVSDKGQYDRAIADFDSAIQLNPNMAEVFNNLGNAYDDKGQPDPAIQDYDQVRRLQHGGATGISV